jgi:hypothetical protein
MNRGLAQKSRILTEMSVFIAIFAPHTEEDLPF